jgi:epoxyqueuosine reductase
LLVEDTKNLPFIKLLSSWTTNTEFYKISKYAYGADYHTVIKDKLKELLYLIQESIGAVSGRAFVDSAPVLDKAWAAKAGLGWKKKI